MHECPRCHKDHVIKNGSVNGKPKKQCKACSYQFTRATPRGHIPPDVVVKLQAVDIAERIS
jgi:transposase-like protein